MLRIAVIGAGLMGRLHARVVSEHDETELMAIVDEDESAERVSRERRVPRFRSLNELFAGGRPDAAIVSVPTSRHVDVALPLLEAGIPVLIEKPIARTVEEGSALVEAAARAGVPLAVGHVERFNPAVRELRRRLAEDALGRVFQVHAQRLSPFPARAGDTGVAHDLATHDLDVMCLLAGTPMRLAAETDHKAQREHEDLVAVLMRFDSGVIGVLEVNWLTPAKIRRLSVTGERGMFVVDYLNQHLTLYENARSSERWKEFAILDGVAEGNLTRFALIREEPLRAQLDAFVRAVRRDAPVAVTGAEGIAVVRLANAVVESGLSEQSLDLSPLLGARRPEA